jgi:thiamine-monophosphate kinase
VDERALIRTFLDRRPGVPPRDDVILGIGDDAALLRFAPGYDLVVATDTVAEGTHFPAGTPAAAIGHRCLAVNLSDLAAMAAQPLWCSLALSLPAAEPAWVAAFADGLLGLAARHGVELVGGDTVRGPLAATVTLQGRVRPGTAVRRTGARPGDGIWVTGTPGDAVAGRLLLAEERADEAAAALRQRFLYPEPRVKEGQSLAGIATAMLDVSDGLDDDLGKLLAASGVGAELDAGALPLGAHLRAVRGADAVACALMGGDDYELLFTVAPADESRLLAVAAGWPVAVTRIGTVVAGAGHHWMLAGHVLDVPDTTYRHFP